MSEYTGGGGSFWDSIGNYFSGWQSPFTPKQGSTLYDLLGNDQARQAYGNKQLATALGGFASGIAPALGYSRTGTTGAQALAMGAGGFTQALQQGEASGLREALTQEQIAGSRAERTRKQGEQDMMRAVLRNFGLLGEDGKPSFGGAGAATAPTIGGAGDPVPAATVAPPAAMGGTNNAGMAFRNLGDSDAYLTSLRGQESGGSADPNNARPLNRDGSQRSSALGPTQFIEPTWKAFAAANPSLFQGMNEQQILDARRDPKMNDRAAVWYANENAKALTEAGLPVNNATLGLSHFLGPQGAIKALQSTPDTPMSSILGERGSAANPEVARQTVGTVLNRYASKFGTPAAGAAPQQVSTGGAASAAAAPQGNSVQATLDRLRAAVAARQQEGGYGANGQDQLTAEYAARQREGGYGPGGEDELTASYANPPAARPAAVPAAAVAAAAPPQATPVVAAPQQPQMVAAGPQQTVPMPNAAPQQQAQALDPAAALQRVRAQNNYQAPARSDAPLPQPGNPAQMMARLRLQAGYTGQPTRDELQAAAMEGVSGGMSGLTAALGRAGTAARARDQWVPLPAGSQELSTFVPTPQAGRSYSINLRTQEVKEGAAPERGENQFAVLQPGTPEFRALVPNPLSGVNYSLNMTTGRVEQSAQPVRELPSPTSVQGAETAALSIRQANASAVQTRSFATNMRTAAELLRNSEGKDDISGTELAALREAATPLINIFGGPDGALAKRLFGGNSLDKLTRAQMVQAMANRTQGTIREAGSGSTSDYEQRLYAGAVIQLGNTPQANQLQAEIANRTAEVQEERASEMERYARKNDSDMSGFNAHWNRLRESRFRIFANLGNSADAVEQARKLPAGTVFLWNGQVRIAGGSN